MSGFGGIDSSGGTTYACSVFGGSHDSVIHSGKRSEALNATAAGSLLLLLLLLLLRVLLR